MAGLARRRRRRARPRPGPLPDARAAPARPRARRRRPQPRRRPTTSTRSRRRREPWFPGDEEVERRYRAWIRWNAAIMVHRAQRPGIGVGGHISTYASSATLYEVGFNHFFRGKDHPGGGDQVYIQGHASPGIYARAFLEGRLTERPARRLPPGEVAPQRRAAVLPAPAADAGLLGVPHGVDGPRARSTRSTRRSSTSTCTRAASRTPRSSTSGRSSATARWTSRRAAARCSSPPFEELDNLTFVVNCNLQRLDGPVRGNGKIIQELEAVLPRRRLERHQGRLGPGVGPAAGRRPRPRPGQPDERHAGRRLPDLPGRGRRLHPGALLRPRPAHPRAWSRTCPTTTSGGSSAAGTTTARSTRPTRRRSSTPASRPSSWPRRSRATALGPHFAGRNATHQMKKLTPGGPQAAARRPADPDQRRAARGRPVPAAVLPPGRRATRSLRYLRDRRRRLGGAVPQRRVARPRPSSCPRTSAYEVRPARLGQAAGRDDDGVRPAAARPHAGQGVRARASCRSSRTRRAPSGWTRSSRRRRSTTRTASSTPRSTAS